MFVLPNQLKNPWFFNENVDVWNAWKWVQFLYQLLVEKNLNFERVKMTLNGQILGFTDHN